jgi:7,8-dihydroneopterin aldolase/epimerase/oxygenase
VSAYTLQLNGVDFYAYHGCVDEEKKLGHRYLVNASIEIDGSAHLTDDVADTIDYAEITAAIIELGVNSQCSLVEYLAKEIVDELLVLYPIISRITLEIAKPHPPIPSILASMAIKYSASR